MLRLLVDRFVVGARIAAARYGGALGVPALIGMEYCDALTDSLTGDSGAGGWLRARSDVIRSICRAPHSTSIPSSRFRRCLAIPPNDRYVPVLLALVVQITITPHRAVPPPLNCSGTCDDPGYTSIAATERGLMKWSMSSMSYGWPST